MDGMPEGRADFRNVTTCLGSRGKSEKGPFQRDAEISETAQTILPSICLLNLCSL